MEHKTYNITLPYHVAQRIEINAARDDQTAAEGIQNLLTHIVEFWIAAQVVDYENL